MTVHSALDARNARDVRAAKRQKLSAKNEDKTLSSPSQSSSSSSSFLDAATDNYNLTNSQFAIIPTAVICVLSTFLNVRDHCSLGQTCQGMKTITRLPQASPEVIRITNQFDSLPKAARKRLEEELVSDYEDTESDDEDDNEDDDDEEDYQGTYDYGSGYNDDGEQDSKEAKVVKVTDKIIKRLLQFSPRKIVIPVSALHIKEYQQLLLQNTRLRELFLEWDKGLKANIGVDSKVVADPSYGYSWLSKLTQLTKINSQFQCVGQLPSSLTELIVDEFDRYKPKCEDLFSMRHLTALQTLKLSPWEHFDFDLSQIGLVLPSLRRLEYGFVSCEPASYELKTKTQSSTSQSQKLRSSLAGLSSCANLEHLSISCDDNDYTYDLSSLSEDQGFRNLRSLELYVKRNHHRWSHLDPAFAKQLAEELRKVTQLKSLKLIFKNFRVFENLSETKSSAALDGFVNILASQPVTLTKLEELFIVGEIPLKNANILSNFNNTLTTMQLFLPVSKLLSLKPIQLTQPTQSLYPHLPHLHTLYLSEMWETEQLKFYAEQLCHVVIPCEIAYDGVKKIPILRQTLYDKVEKILTILSNTKMNNLKSISVPDDIYFQRQPMSSSSSSSSKPKRTTTPHVSELVAKFKVSHPEISVLNYS